jgi:uroporphyrinogen III methyltransferase/synthase
MRTIDGRTVLVTRPLDQAGELVRLLEARGAAAIVAPAIQLRPIRSAALTEAVAGLATGRFAWVTLTSAATVDVLAARIVPQDVRAAVAVVGEGTASAFARWTGRSADLMPAVFETEALGAAFPRGRGWVLCLRADLAPSGLETALRTKGWAPQRVDAYRTALARRLPEEARTALRDGLVDAITFTSASTVRGFVRALQGPPATDVAGRPRIACIGPVTAKEARAAGFRVSSVARPHTIEGLAQAVERSLRTRRTR